MTPARPDAAAGFGNRPQGIISSAVSCIQTHAVARVERWWWPDLWWPEPTTASSKAATGVRVCLESALWCTVRQTGGLDRLLGAARARCHAQGQAGLAQAMVTTSPAASTTRLCASVARARNRRGEKRGIDRRLTGVATVASGSSGRRQGGHTVAGDLGGRSLKKRSGKPLQGTSARVAWRRWCRGLR